MCRILQYFVSIFAIPVHLRKLKIKDDLKRITIFMNITLNNEPVTIEAESITVEKLLEIKKYTFRLRIVRINGRLIDRDNYNREEIHNGDSVQVIYLMSGG